MPLKKLSRDRDSNIVERIRKDYDSFSESYKLVANFVMSNLEAATFRSLQDLSNQIGVSDATLIRFSQDLGYSDFKEFREHLADYIRKIIYSKTLSFPTPGAIQPGLENVKRKDIDFISRTMEKINPEWFSDATDEILLANRIFCMGWRISSFLAEFLVFQLRRIGYPAFSVIRDPRPLAEQVLFLNEGDLLIVFDQLIYSEEVFEAVQYVRTQCTKVKIVTITNDPLAQIVQYADMSFFIDLVGQKNFSLISLTAPMCFINAIIEEVFSRNPEEANSALKLYEDVILSNPHHAITFHPARRKKEKKRQGNPR